jgi:hypothetical protein
MARGSTVYRNTRSLESSSSSQRVVRKMGVPHLDSSIKVQQQQRKLGRNTTATTTPTASRCGGEAGRLRDCRTTGVTRTSAAATSAVNQPGEPHFHARTEPHLHARTAFPCSNRTASPCSNRISMLEPNRISMLKPHFHARTEPHPCSNRNRISMLEQKAAATTTTTTSFGGLTNAERAEVSGLRTQRALFEAQRSVREQERIERINVFFSTGPTEPCLSANGHNGRNQTGTTTMTKRAQR